MVVARVVLVPSPRPLTTLDYGVPTSLGTPAVGMRVLVPLGPRRRMGVVLSVHRAESRDERLRDLISILDREPVLDSTLLELVAWMADYYLIPLSEAVATALPGALRVETDRYVEIVEGEPSVRVVLCEG